ncbi:hypothetical protein QBC39DRAFT_138867 [Podospora conica]|nr:hypothetical protein QBC39DRAFT_138867 [Schizothecium conicum]
MMSRSRSGQRALDSCWERRRRETGFINEFRRPRQRLGCVAGTDGTGQRGPFSMTFFFCPSLSLTWTPRWERRHRWLPTSQRIHCGGRSRASAGVLLRWATATTKATGTRTDHPSFVFPLRRRRHHATGINTQHLEPLHTPQCRDRLDSTFEFDCLRRRWNLHPVPVSGVGTHRGLCGTRGGVQRRTLLYPHTSPTPSGLFFPLSSWIQHPPSYRA